VGSGVGKLSEDFLGSKIPMFQVIIRVGDRTDNKIFILNFIKIQRSFGDFNIGKFTPSFIVVVSKSAHEFGIAILTTMRTTNIGVDHKISVREFRGGDKIFDGDRLGFEHERYYIMAE
jgi:hypothetical protein